MIQNVKNRSIIVLLIAVTWTLASTTVRADAVTEWNRTAGDIIVDSGMGPLPADRALAIVQAAVYEAANAITHRYPVSDLKLKGMPGASVDGQASAPPTAAAVLHPAIRGAATS